MATACLLPAISVSCTPVCPGIPQHYEVNTDLRFSGPLDEVQEANPGQIAFGNIVVTFPPDERMDIPAVGTKITIADHIDGSDAAGGPAQGEIEVSDTAGLLLSLQQVNPDGGRNPPNPRWTVADVGEEECIAGADVPVFLSSASPTLDNSARLRQGESAVISADGVDFLASDIWAFVIDNEAHSPWLYGFLYRLRE